MGFYVKLGPKAKSFWDPKTQTKVLPGQVVEVKKKSWLIEAAIEGHHLLVVESPKMESQTQETSFSFEIPDLKKVKKEDLIDFVKPYVGDVSLQESTKADLQDLAQTIASYLSALNELPNKTQEELQEVAEEVMDEAQFEEWLEAGEPLEVLQKAAYDYYFPIEVED